MTSLDDCGFFVPDLRFKGLANDVHDPNDRAASRSILFPYSDANANVTSLAI